MKSATKKSSKAAAMTAASWDAVWTAYTAAKRGGDAMQLSEAKCGIRSWYIAAGQSVPDWAM